MSLVFPRPALPALPLEVRRDRASSSRRPAWHDRPGQVSGRSDLSWEKSVELDLHYTDNYRLTDDLLIGLRTVDAVLRPHGAY